MTSLGAKTEAVAGTSAARRMPLVLFSKHFGSLSVDQLIEKAHQWGIEGYDLACRNGQTVSPETVATLPDVARRVRRAGLDIPMLTGATNLVDPSHPTAEPILAAMNEADIRRFKLGYWPIDNAADDYWAKVDAARRQLGEWEKLARKHGVRVCYHTHSGPGHLGMNAAAVMHLVSGFDPQWIGIYLDPGHLILDGEHPDAAFNMVKRYLAIVALKDAIKAFSPIARGYDYTFARAGYGQVDWRCVFENLRRLGFSGPLSMHAEYDRYMPADAQGKKPQYEPSLIEEAAYFKRMRDGVL